MLSYNFKLKGVLGSLIHESFILGGEDFFSWNHVSESKKIYQLLSIKNRNFIYVLEMFFFNFEMFYHNSCLSILLIIHTDSDEHSCRSMNFTFISLHVTFTLYVNYINYLHDETSANSS